MNEIDTAIQWIIGVLSLFCAGEAGYIIRQKWKDFKARDDARAAKKKAEADGHKKTQKLLEEVVKPLQSENTMLRAQDAVKSKRIADLERDLTNALKIKDSAKGKKV